MLLMLTTMTCASTDHLLTDKMLNFFLNPDFLKKVQIFQKFKDLLLKMQ